MKIKLVFISTIHQETGKCNPDELCAIIKEINPNVIFLESLEKTYSKYQQYNFLNFDIFHHKLEICAIQKYYGKSNSNFIPVLDKPMSEAFETKYKLVCENIDFNKMQEDFNFIASTEGFDFLNSERSIELHEKMRHFENELLEGNDLNEKANQTIDEYENSMIQNIYKYCSENQFERGIFMCGNAHRKSIIEKIKKANNQDVKLNWVDLNNEPLS
jgi:hypothetical protein